MSHPYDILDIPGHAGRLLFTPCPGTKGTPITEALTTITSAGAQVLVTLMPNSELAANQADDLPARCAEQGIEWWQLPVADEQVPMDDFDAAWHRHRDTLLTRLAAGATLAIHCKGGSGRTGLIAARILIELGMPREAAVNQVQALRPKAIRHPAHVGWLAQFGD